MPGDISIDEITWLRTNSPAWLAGLDLVYLGDIDTHGLAILSRVRHRFPHARSILMDEATLLARRAQWGTEPAWPPR